METLSIGDMDKYETWHIVFCLKIVGYAMSIEI